MNNFVAIEFYEKKTNLLKDCIYMNDRLFASVDDLDLLNELIEKRGAIVHDLDTLNVIVDDSIKNLLSDEQKAMIDRLVTMLIDQDQGLLEILNEKRSELLNFIKNTVKTKNVIKYIAAEVSDNGSYMNFKK